MSKNTNIISSNIKLVIEKWINVKKGDNVLVVTDKNYQKEADLLVDFAIASGANAQTLVIAKTDKQAGVYFDENENIFDEYNIIIGATGYSLITTKATKRAIQKKSRYLSIPLKTNTGKSLFEYDFFKMDTNETKKMGTTLVKNLCYAKKIEIKTDKGTELTIYKRNRIADYFNGKFEDRQSLSSASLEVYIPIEETMTNGTIVVDGSCGYIGKVEEDFSIKLSEGKIIEIDDSKSGEIFARYLNSFDDTNMAFAGELGIGLNKLSKCIGNSYIEDESTYKTFHIGFGRNIGLGGVHDATAHFDIVVYHPNIYADGKLIIKKGEIIF